MPAQIAVRVTADRFDPGAELAALAGDGRAGALVSFVGTCRDEDGRLGGLELEHYPGMAEAELARIAGDAADRFGLFDVRVVHRFGPIVPGEEIVFVGCTAAHRQAAFDGASCLMDFLKSAAPFWKRERLADGTPGGWVAAKESDAEAAGRWR